MQNKIFNIQTPEDFKQVAFSVFRHQFENNKVYRSFCDLLYIHPSDVHALEDIPFLPIQFFKSRKILSSLEEVQETFTSSGTTGSITSKHFVTDINLYKESYLNGFSHFYGNIEDYVVLALLPNYLEREGSSLVFMVNELIKQSNNINSGFYLNDFSSLIQKIEYLENNNRKTLLVGVSYALLDLIEIKKFKLENTIIMETGGMKGRRKEMIKKYNLKLKQEF